LFERVAFNGFNVLAKIFKCGLFVERSTYSLYSNSWFIFFHDLSKTKNPGFMGRDFLFFYMFSYRILVPALTGKVKVVTIKVCVV